MPEVRKQNMQMYDNDVNNTATLFTTLGGMIDTRTSFAFFASICCVTQKIVRQMSDLCVLKGCRCEINLTCSFIYAHIGLMHL